MRFVRFVENNEHEGETWTFWLQVDGNEAALADLWNFLIDQEESEPIEYELFDFEYKTLSEHDVDVLVEYGGEGYMGLHNKVTGVFNYQEPSEDLRELYKGGIRKYFNANS